MERNLLGIEESVENKSRSGFYLLWSYNLVGIRTLFY